MNDSKKITTKKTYVQTDGWRGYEQPLYWVAGANDTGTWSDSPCPSGVATEELNHIKKALRKEKIKFREIGARTSNVFCLHRYILVAPFDFERGKEIVNTLYSSGLKDGTRLLYVNK